MSHDKQIVMMLVRSREDFQHMRKAIDGRLGRKANGEKMNIDERPWLAEDIQNFTAIADAARKQEEDVEKMLKKVLKRFPIYTEWLEGVKGVGMISAGWIVGSFDIHLAKNVSKMWQYAGMNPGMIRGKKRIKVSDYNDSSGQIVTKITNEGRPDEYIVLTDELIRGDKLTKGFVSPYNKDLKTALLGVMASGFIKAQNEYAIEHYYRLHTPKSRREELGTGRYDVSEKTITGTDTMWKDASEGHKDRAAKRVMVKEFLKDLYVAWRQIEGLPVREPYAKEYLGKSHAA